MNPAATVGIDEALETCWDAVVIGAGPAGAVTSYQLSRKGLKTLLVERKAFPRDKVCGGCLNARALSVLQSLGLGHLCRQIGGAPVDVLEIRRNGRALRLGVPGGAAVLRSAFDAALVSAACRAGAAFLPETTCLVRPLEAADSATTCTVALRQRGRGAGEAATRVAVACDGLGHPSLKSLPQFRCRIAGGSRVGVGTVVDRSGSEYGMGRVFMAVGRAGYVGVARLDQRRLIVAAALDPAFLRQHGSPGTAAAAILREAGAPIVPLEQAEFRGTVPLTRQTPEVAGRRLFVLGDAAGYVEPFTGEGMAWALSAAAAVAPLVRRASSAWDDGLAEQWRRTFRRSVRRRQWICRSVAGVLKRPWATRSALALASAFPAAVSPLVHQLNSAPAERKIF